MIDIAILCSGQGSQSVGMFDVLADDPRAEPIFRAATVVLDGIDPRRLVAGSTGAALHANRLGQILCCTQALAAWSIIGDALPRPLLVAGYSVGELAAWGVAGLLDAAGILGLAARRAAVMDEATTEPSGLLAVRGLRRGPLDAMCRDHGVAIAVVNAADQMLVGGTRAALTIVAQAAEAAGALSTTPLAVEVASHTPALAAASERFAEALKVTNWRPSVPPDIRLLSGIDGEAVFNVAAGAEKLARQIRQTVDWAACMDACRAAGVTKVIELGPGSGLARLMRDAMPDADIHSLSEFRSLTGFETWVGKPSR